MATEHGVTIVAPDDSPRSADVADDDGYDLGQGAGFCVNAIQPPWNRHYHMYDYVLNERSQQIEGSVPALVDQGEGDNHSYHFIASFIKDHLRFRAGFLTV